MNIDKKLSFWINKNYNVLFKGKHGVGKTTMIVDAWNAAGLKWMYFSAATMDPWVDFIGVPKEVKSENGRSYLELIRPKQFQDDEVEALFFDEFNRAPKKIRNAVMELIQFKSINGKKFEKLKIIWAAINPDDDKDQKYDVEQLDPAQLDRFHVITEIPYEPHVDFFRKKYGDELADAAVAWWRTMPVEIKRDVSPRRLDYALNMYSNGGDMRDVLPKNANVSNLLTQIQNGSLIKKMKRLFIEKQEDEAKKFLAVENNFAACVDLIVKDTQYASYFVPLLSEEKISSLVSKYPIIQDLTMNNFPKYELVLREIAKANANKKLTKRLNEVIEGYDYQRVLALSGNNDNIRRHFNPETTPEVFEENLALCRTGVHTQQRERNYHILNDNLSKTFSVPSGIKALSVLNEIIERSHDNTMNKFVNLIPMINHIIAALAETNSLPAMSKQLITSLKAYPEFIFNQKLDTGSTKQNIAMPQARGGRHS